MKLLFSNETLARKIAQDPDDEPGGLLAVSPRLLDEAERCAGRVWDGSQEDVERLVFGLFCSNAPTPQAAGTAPSAS